LPIFSSVAPSSACRPSFPSKAEATPAVVVHTGPHNRPKRVRRPKAKSASNKPSRKAAAKMRVGLARGYP